MLTIPREELEAESLADELLKESSYVKNAKRIKKLKEENQDAMLSLTSPTSTTTFAPIPISSLNDFVLDKAWDIYLEELQMKRETRKAKEALIRSGKYKAQKEFEEEW